ncbi:hypothetical protein NDU88_005143, partial [Pleurodeles waltl]
IYGGTMEECPAETSPANAAEDVCGCLLRVQEPGHLDWEPGYMVGLRRRAQWKHHQDMLLKRRCLKRAAKDPRAGRLRSEARFSYEDILPKHEQRPVVCVSICSEEFSNQHTVVVPWLESPPNV